MADGIGAKLLGILKAAIIDAPQAIGEQIVLPAAEKMVPHGAAELAQLLNTGSAFLPYGPSQEEVPQGVDQAEAQQTEHALPDDARLPKAVDRDPLQQARKRAQENYGKDMGPEMGK